MPRRYWPRKDALRLAKRVGESPTRLRSGGVRMGKPVACATANCEIDSIYRIILAEGRVPGELKHLSNPWKRNHRDSVSSGERKRNSLNHSQQWLWCCRTADLNVKRVKKEEYRRKRWNCVTRDGDSPVFEMFFSLCLFLSTMGYD